MHGLVRLALAAVLATGSLIGEIALAAPSTAAPPLAQPSPASKPSAVSNSSAVSKPSPSTSAIAVTDDLGRTVSLAAPARRIVALAPHLVENLFSAGGGDRLVGAVDYADYPPAAKSAPSVGGFHAYSLEAIALLQPDLILTWATGAGSEELRALGKLGVPVYASEPQSLASIAEEIRKLGRLVGNDATAAAAADVFETQLAALRQTHKERAPLKVFYQVWDQPLQTVGGDQLISEVINTCGGINIFADAPSLAPKVSLEGVLTLNPDVIVASGMGEARPEWLDTWRNYPQLAAVRHGALVHIHPDLLQRPSARIAQGASQLCKELNKLGN